MTRRNYDALVSARVKLDNLPLAGVMIECLIRNEPDTVRGVMYSVVSAGWLPDTSKKSYSRVQRLLNGLRKKGAIPFPWVVDNVRSTQKPNSWSGLSDFADTVRNVYRKDFWASLPEYVCVICEKDAVAGRLAPVTREYNVALHPLRGYSSTSFAWGIAHEWKRIEKPIHVYYVGDHDPSGRDIERSVIGALKDYSGRDFTWRRLGVNPEHFDQFNMLPLAAKSKDKRYRKFVEEFGDDCAEVEAIPAPSLRAMVRDAIESHIPHAEWERLKHVEQVERESWGDMMSKMLEANA